MMEPCFNSSTYGTNTYEFKQNGCFITPFDKPKKKSKKREGKYPNINIFACVCMWFVDDT